MDFSRQSSTGTTVPPDQDTSSASSLSFFADQNEVQNSRSISQTAYRQPKSGESSSSRTSMDDVLKSDKAFIDFVMSLPTKETPTAAQEHHRSVDSVSTRSRVPQTSGSGGSSSTKVGLDHLDNLCKLMEQLSELRDTNGKLQKRVQYLEDLKSLHDMHKEIREELPQAPSSEKPEAGYELQKSATETCYREDRRAGTKNSVRRSRHPSVQSGCRERSKSVGHEDGCDDPKSRRIFPKWSRVKEAFGFESERSNTVKSTKMERETSYSASPRRRSDEARTGRHSCVSSPWTQDYGSLHSSAEDVSVLLEGHRRDTWNRNSLASEKGMSVIDAPVESLRRQKSTPSPGSERMHAYRENIDLKPKSSTLERDTLADLAKDDAKRGKGPWGRVKTIIERRRDSLKRRSQRRDLPTSTPIRENELSCRRVTDCDLPEMGDPEPSPKDAKEAEHTPTSSPTFHRKSRWTRVKKVLRGRKEDERENSCHSTPVSPNGVQDDTFNFDANEDISQDSCEEGREITRVGSDSYVHQLAISSATSDLMMQLQRNLSEDFHRKIREWERMRNSGRSHWERKNSGAPKPRKKSERYDKSIKPKLKDLSWLEKELQKIEKEKLRLSKEKQKYEERATRLEKLKETVLSARNSNKKEVLVRTSAGEFRFEGISDAFTKKLYEWETKRGLGPELSTIALLDSSCLSPVQPCPKVGALQRVVSRSESSIVDVGQPSHNSSNSLPSLKPPDVGDQEKLNHHSRANSEPDLSTLAAISNGTATNSMPSIRRESVGDSLEDELANQETCEEESRDNKQRKDSESYYGLLEENVILLEQLKDKEEICRKLEKELEHLDEKMEEMNVRHAQEMERYREKLWEMHKHSTSPSDVQNCLQTIAHLRRRLEALEKCTEKLRNDRETVEDSFRYHSKQQEHMTADLLGKIRELRAAGTVAAKECEMKKSVSNANLDARAVEKIQDLSALLLKQTQELEQTLSEKTKQICQLKWELLNRDLSAVRLETEIHSKTAHCKRTKYAHLRSRSSEEPTEALPMQVPDITDKLPLVEIYNKVLCPEGFQATELTNTVQQLNKEILKLASTQDTSGGNDLDKGRVLDPPAVEQRLQAHKETQVPASKIRSKQITIRRSSADNISLTSVSQDGWTHEASTSTDSENSSEDECYTRVSLGPNKRTQDKTRTKFDVERVLTSHGERANVQRRRKLYRISRSSSNPCRKKLNVPNSEPSNKQITPQKCHSFHNHHDSEHRDAINFLDKYDENAPRGKDISKQLGYSNTDCNMNIQADIDDHRFLREVSSDSKIPFLIEVQRLIAEAESNQMSDKKTKESSNASTENNQKRQIRRRLKVTDSPTYAKHRPQVPKKDPVHQDCKFHDVSVQVETELMDDAPPKCTESTTQTPTVVVSHDKLNSESVSLRGDDKCTETKWCTKPMQERSNKLEKLSLELSAPNYVKSPSAPQLDWRKACAKKVTKEGAPNVKGLIERYNQKILESQSPSSPMSSTVSSPAIPRKISAPEQQRPKRISQYSFSNPTTPTVVPVSTFYNPLVFKPTNLDLFPKSLPSSPASRARSEALRKAKETFISSPYSPVPKQTECTTPPRQDELVSSGSMDSMNLVVCRTGQSCQESRFSRRTVAPIAEAPPEPNALKPSKSLSNSSLFRAVDAFKMPASLLRLRRSRRKKDMATVSQLCRQSLYIADDNVDVGPRGVPHRSCPSSPELKSKVDPKQGWFQRTLFRHK